MANLKKGCKSNSAHASGLVGGGVDSGGNSPGGVSHSHGKCEVTDNGDVLPTLSSLVVQDVLTNSGEYATLVRKVEPLIQFLSERHFGNKLVEHVIENSLRHEYYT